MRTRTLLLIAAVAALLVAPAPALAAKKVATFKFSAAKYSVTEGNVSATITVNRTGTRTSAVSVDYSTLNTGTATAGSDYTAISPAQTLNFAAGQTSRTFTVQILDDALIDPNETVKLHLSNPSANAQIGNGGAGDATLTIIDDDGPGTIDFSSAAYSVVESGGLATITVTRQSATNISESVHYATGGGSATAGADYTATSGTLTFAINEMSKSFQVPISDDQLFEGPESLNLTLSNPLNLTNPGAIGNPALGPNNPATLTIDDDDVPIFGFSSATYSVDENDPAGHATITVTRSGATNIAASIDYSDAGTGSATGGGTDYTLAPGTLMFNAGETTKTFDVPINNDAVSEANETVALQLTQNATPVATATLSIVDNDNPKASAQLSDVSYGVSEADGHATVTVNLSKPVDGDVTVHYATSDGTATAGQDYTATSGDLTFLGKLSPGGPQTTKTFDIPITNDTDVETDETVNIALTVSTPLTAVLGDPHTAVLTLADDDPPGSLEFDSLSYNASETSGHATVTVRRVDGIGGTVTVDYATSDGTADSNDYTPTSGTLTFNPGDVEESFDVPIAWDGRGEGPETVNLALSNPTGGADLAPNDAAVIHIADDGASGPVRLNAASYGAAESDGSATITVTRTGGSLGGPVTVDYATADGSATAGSDYTATSGTLTFAAGEVTKTFQIPIVNDSAYEDSETVAITLSNVTGGAAVGSPAQATLTIADDDAAPAPTGGQPGGGQPGGTSTPGASNPSQSQALAGDTVAPRLTLTVKKLQKALKAKAVVVAARCNEACSLSAVAKAGKVAALARATTRARAATRVVLKLRLSRKTFALLRAALRHHRANVTVTVVAADIAGNRATAARTITVVG